MGAIYNLYVFGQAKILRLNSYDLSTLAESPYTITVTTRDVVWDSVNEKLFLMATVPYEIDASTLAIKNTLPTSVTYKGDSISFSVYNSTYVYCFAHGGYLYVPVNISGTYGIAQYSTDDLSFVDMYVSGSGVENRIECLATDGEYIYFTGTVISNGVNKIPLDFSDYPDGDRVATRSISGTYGIYKIVYNEDGYLYCSRHRFDDRLVVRTSDLVIVDNESQEDDVFNRRAGIDTIDKRVLYWTKNDPVDPDIREIDFYSVPGLTKTSAFTITQPIFRLYDSLRIGDDLYYVMSKGTTVGDFVHKRALSNLSVISAESVSSVEFNTDSTTIFWDITVGSEIVIPTPQLAAQQENNDVKLTWEYDLEEPEE